MVLFFCVFDQRLWFVTVDFALELSGSKPLNVTCLDFDCLGAGSSDRFPHIPNLQIHIAQHRGDSPEAGRTAWAPMEGAEADGSLQPLPWGGLWTPQELHGLLPSDARFHPEAMVLLSRHPVPSREGALPQRGCGERCSFYKALFSK